MTLSIHGNHCNTGEALKQHAANKLETLAQKFFGRNLDGSVTFSKTQNKGFRANAIMHVGHKVYQADAIAPSAHVALDAAANKLAKQLRRAKTRIRDDHHQRDKARMERMLDQQSALA